MVVETMTDIIHLISNTTSYYATQNAISYALEFEWGARASFEIKNTSAKRHRETTATTITKKNI